MKKGVILLLVLLCLVSIAFAKTEYHTFSIGESFVFDDKLITLLGIDDDDEKALVCVNNMKAIIGENEKTVNDVVLDGRDFTDDDVELRIEYDCKSTCNCDDDCQKETCGFRIPNIPRNDSVPLAMEPSSPPIAGSVVNEIKINKMDESKNSSSGAKGVFFVLVILAVLFALVALLLRP